jgi:hypothetical protein
MIGNGAFGDIYICTNLEMDEICAMKIEDLNQSN